MLTVALILLGILAYVWTAHHLSYHVGKKRILKRRRWDLNICCGRTDGGGMNADIATQTDLPSFFLVSDIYRLPFPDSHFEHVLCSHTIEHVDHPESFFKELQRVGRRVTIVVPPLWDIGAALDIFEHKWIFLTFRKVHTALPKHIRFPLAEALHVRLGQWIRG